MKINIYIYNIKTKSYIRRLPINSLLTNMSVTNNNELVINDSYGIKIHNVTNGNILDTIIVRSNEKFFVAMYIDNIMFIVENKKQVILLFNRM
jgi:hypothetical protein